MRILSKLFTTIFKQLPKSRLPNSIEIEGKKFIRIKLDYFDQIEVVDNVLMTDLQYEICKLRSEIDFLNEKLEKKQQLVDQLSNLNKNLLYENNTLIQDIKGVKELNKKLNKQILDHKSNISELVLVKHEKLKETISTAAELLDLKRENKKLNKQIEQLNPKVIESKINDLKTIYEQKSLRLFEKIEILEIANAELKNRKIENELSELRQSLRLKESEISKLRATNNELKSNLNSNTKITQNKSNDSLELIEVYALEIQNQDKINKQLLEKIVGLEKRLNNQKV